MSSPACKRAPRYSLYPQPVSQMRWSLFIHDTLFFRDAGDPTEMWHPQALPFVTLVPIRSWEGGVSKLFRTGNQGITETTASWVNSALFSSYKCRIEEAAFNFNCRIHLVSLAVFFPWIVCPPFTVEYKDGNMIDWMERASRSIPSLPTWNDQKLL